GTGEQPAELLLAGGVEPLAQRLQGGGASVRRVRRQDALPEQVGRAFVFEGDQQSDGGGLSVLARLLLQQLDQLVGQVVLLRGSEGGDLRQERAGGGLDDAGVPVQQHLDRGDAGAGGAA